MKKENKQLSSDKFHNVSLIVCPACGFSYRYSSITSKKNKRKRISPQCGYKFTTPELIPGKFDNKRY